MSNTTSRPRRPVGGFGGHGMGNGEKAKDFKGTTRKLLSYMGRYKIGVALVILFAILSTIFLIVGPKILSGAITNIFNGLVGKLAGTGGIDFAAIGATLLLLLGLYLLSSAFSFIQGFIMSGIAQKMSFRMRREISEKINRMPLSYFEITKNMCSLL